MAQAWACLVTQGTPHLIWLRMLVLSWGPDLSPTEGSGHICPGFSELWTSPMGVQALIFSGLAFFSVPNKDYNSII